VNGAETALNGAAGTFGAAKTEGTKQVNRTALQSALSAAGVKKDGVVTSENGTDVTVNKYWVTEAAMTAFNSAINAAQAVYDDYTAEQDAVDQAVEDLNDAISVFNPELGSWNTVTVTFNANGGTLTGSPTVEVGIGGTIDALPTAPLRDGYLFTGWKDGAGEDFDTSYIVNTAITVSAQWTEGFTVTTGGIVSSTTPYGGILVPAASSYDLGYFGGDGNVLRSQNSSGNALTITINPDFSGTLRLNFSAKVRVDTASKLAWVKQGANSFPLFGSDFTVKAADAWYTFTASGYELAVTSGTPVVFQLSDGGDNGDFSFYIKDFSITAKKYTPAGDMPVLFEDFEGSPPEVLKLPSTSGQVTSEIAVFDNSNILKITASNYDQAGAVKITVPAGKTLGSYKTIRINTALIGGSGLGYKELRFYINSGTVTSLNSTWVATTGNALSTNNNPETSLVKTIEFSMTHANISNDIRNLGPSDDVYFTFSVQHNNYVLGVDNITLVETVAESEVFYPLYSGQEDPDSAD
jgi:hypothetical protein